MCTQFTSKLRYFRLMMRKALSPGDSDGGAYSLQRSPSHTPLSATEHPPPPQSKIQKSPHAFLFLHPPLHILCSIYYKPSSTNIPPSQRKNLIDLGHDLGNLDQDLMHPDQDSRFLAMMSKILPKKILNNFKIGLIKIHSDSKLRDCVKTDNIFFTKIKQHTQKE